jgi:hypothetical protein
LMPFDLWKSIHPNRSYRHVIRRLSRGGLDAR